MPPAKSQPKPRPKPVPKPGNRQRIIEATVQLMNEQGGAVGTSQIAEFLGISPGNLYYHFRNREEILRELFDGLSRELDEVLRVEPGEPIPVERLVACYTGGAKVLWRYRFFLLRQPISSVAMKAWPSSTRRLAPARKVICG